MVEQVLNIDHNRFQSFKCICNDFAAVFVSTFKIISYCIKFCFLGDIQTYRMIHLSIFMYEALSDETKKFHRDRYRDFFSRPNVFETDTETFFRDQMFLRPIPRLFFETKCFRDRYRDFFLRPNVFETDTETFLRPNFFETDTETFAKVKK